MGTNPTSDALCAEPLELRATVDDLALFEAVDLSSGLVPAKVAGHLDARGDAEGTADLVAALNGIIQEWGARTTRAQM